jgi:glycine/D-amino acid oxidase-like deaminating enzyme
MAQPPPDPMAFERTLWKQTASPTFVESPLIGEATADVAIVGGGFSGLSAALHLAEAGQRVVLIEAREPGYGASGRNAAGWLPKYLDRTPDDVERLLGSRRGEALNRMITEAGTLVPDLIARHNIAADLRHSGILVCSHRSADANALEDLRSQWNVRGGAVDAIDRKRLHALTGSAAFRSGVLFRAAGTLNPLAYARGLAAATRRAGTRIHCGDAVRKIAPHAGRWHIATARGGVDARQVLIATEGCVAIDELWPGLEATCYRLPMAVIASQPVPELVQRLLPAGIPISDMNKANPFWTMADAEGRIVASLLPPRSDAATPKQVAASYEAKLHRIYGELPPITWTHFWMGTVAVSPERIPRLLRLADGVHAIGGYSGQGIAAATGAGREYARLIAARGDEDACRLPVLDPEAVPLRRLLPQLFRQVMAPLARTQDRSYR